MFEVAWGSFSRSSHISEVLFHCPLVAIYVDQTIQFVGGPVHSVLTRIKQDSDVRSGEQSATL
jgi:hypothetical protein